MTNDPVLHALVDLVQAVEKQGMVGPATPAYENALKVIRDHVGEARPEVTDIEIKNVGTLQRGSYTAELMVMGEPVTLQGGQSINLKVSAHQGARS